MKKHIALLMLSLALLSSNIFSMSYLKKLGQQTISFKKQDIIPILTAISLTHLAYNGQNKIDMYDFGPLEKEKETYKKETIYYHPQYHTQEQTNFKPNITGHIIALGGAALMFGFQQINTIAYTLLGKILPKQKMEKSSYSMLGKSFIAITTLAIATYFKRKSQIKERIKNYKDALNGAIKDGKTVWVNIENKETVKKFSDEILNKINSTDKQKNNYTNKQKKLMIASLTNSLKGYRKLKEILDKITDTTLKTYAKENIISE